jgi:pilus assembly protein CpaE
MKSLPQIVLTTEQTSFAEKFAQAVRENQNVSLAGTCLGMSELKTCLESAKAPIAVVDIDSDPPRMLRELDRLVPLFPSTRFAVASSDSSQELMLEAMQAGARHFMNKKSIVVELDKILERLLVDSSTTVADLGRVVTVFSASGGCGATTVCLNLANEFRLESNQPVLTIDMDNSYGAVASYLGITGEYSIDDVLRHKNRIDSEFITTSATKYKDNFDVLVSATGASDNESDRYQHLTEVLNASRGAYKYIIVDAPRLTAQTMRMLANVSKAVLLVFQANVKDIKIAKNMLSTLRGFNIGQDKIFPVVNRYDKWWGPLVPIEEVQKALGTERLFTVRNNFKKVVNCVNRGLPLSELAPRSGIRKDFQRLVNNLHGRNGNGKK